MQAEQKQKLTCSTQQDNLLLDSNSHDDTVEEEPAAPNSANSTPTKTSNLDEIKRTIGEKQALFQETKKARTMLQSKANSPETREAIARVIIKEKERLVSEVRRKFSSLYDNVKLAQKKVYEDLVRSFRVVSKKVTEMTKEEGDAGRMYKMWELKCSGLMEKAERARNIEEKGRYYIDGPLDILKDGQALLRHIEAKMEGTIRSVQDIVSKIHIQENQAAGYGVFNYINIKFEEDVPSPPRPSQQKFLSPAANRTQHLSPDCSNLHLISNLHPHGRLSIPSPRKSKELTPSKGKRSSQGKIERKKSTASSFSTDKRDAEKVLEEFCLRDKLDTLDLTNCQLGDSEIIDALVFVKSTKKIRGLKLVKNSLTSQGLLRMLQLIPCATNLNLSFNQLKQDALGHLLKHRTKVPLLRIINLSNNKLNERRAKTFIDELKRQGLIVTL